MDALARKTKVANILGDACEQLESVRSDRTINVVWIFSPESDRHLHYEQFKAAAYGEKIATGPGCLKPCYYCGISDFYKHGSTLDGIALGAFGCLLLNEFSPRYESLRSSKFRMLFGETVLDPLVLEAEGKILAVRGDVDRRSEKAMKSYLLKEYQVEVNNFTHLVRLSA